jgi:uncharacterized protein involved in exopolysaccharide biosynthesis
MKEFLEVIFRRKRLFIIPFLVIFLIPSIFSFFFLRTYEASALLWVDSDTALSRLALNQTGGGGSLPAARYLETLTQLLESRTFIERVVNKTDLKGKVKTARELSKIKARLKAFSVGPNTIKVVYYGRNPVLAKQIVQATTEEFVDWNLEFIQKENAATISFFESQLELSKKKWEESRKALQKFKEKHPETELLEERKLTLSPIKTGATPQVKLEFDRLQKEYEYTSKMLESAIDDLAQAKVTAEVKLYKQKRLFRIIDPPRVPATFSRKKLLLPIAVSFFLALAFSLGLVTFVEWMDQSIKTEEEASKTLDIPVLASIPKISGE